MKKYETSNTALLKKEFRRLKKHHREAILKRVAKSCVGSSTLRVFKDSSQIKERLRNIDADELLKIRSEDDFKNWFKNELNRLRVKLECRESGLMITLQIGNDLF
ncbi:MAG: hypothetical protein WC476_12585 [Phycisphaerae bacterium]|jgi:4-diphosphocytidyl-2C-methyl-D-erythritol kinase